MNKILILCIFLFGCAPTCNLDCLLSIEQRVHTLNYGCYQKARDASKCFRKHGFDAYTVCGPVKGLKRHHCWVEINNGKIYWYDPTWVFSDPRYGYWEKSKYKDRKVYKAKYSGVKYPKK